MTSTETSTEATPEAEAETERPHDVRAITGRATWSGFLTAQNLPAVAERINRMLGGKHFTRVEVFEYRRFRPDVRPSQRLRGPIKVKSLDSGGAHAVIEDGNYVYFLDARISDQAAARAIADADRADARLVRLCFTDTQIQGEEVLPDGKRVYWTFAVEDHADY
jgi:hypothetical protein